MVRHWTRLLRNETDPKARGKMMRSRVVNTVGFVATGAVLLVVLVTKFLAGAWIAIVAMISLFIIMKLIRKHYDAVNREIAEHETADNEVVLPSRNHAIGAGVEVASADFERALAYARATRPDVLEAVTVGVDDPETRELVRKWQHSDISVPLKVIASPYREVTRPVLDYVKRVNKESPRTVVTVFIPELVVGHWWEHVLHNQSALRLKGRLLFMPGVMVTSVPWQLNSSERVKAFQPHAAPGDARRGSSIDFSSTLESTALQHPQPAPAHPRTIGGHWCPGERRQLRGAPRRPGGVRPLRPARRAGAGAGHGRQRGCVLARRGCRSDRAVGRSDHVLVPDRRGGRRGVLRLGVRRGARGPRAQSASRSQSAGADRRAPLVVHGSRRGTPFGILGWGGFWARSWARFWGGPDRLAHPRAARRGSWMADPGFHRYHSEELVTDLR